MSCGVLAVSCVFGRIPCEKHRRLLGTQGNRWSTTGRERGFPNTLRTLEIESGAIAAEFPEMIADFLDQQETMD